MSSVAQRLSGGGSAFLAAAQADARGHEEAQARSEIIDERTGRVRRASKVPLSAIVFNPYNPRKTHSEEALSEMAMSLQARGQVTPITAVSRQAFLDAHPGQEEAIGNAEFIALDGNRRLQAAHLAGLDSVRVDLNDDLAATAADMLESALIANIHREDVPPIEEAHAIHELLTKVYDGNQAAVARALSKSRQWLGQRLALLHLTPELQEQVERKELGVKQARAIGADARAGRLAPEQQLAAAEEAKLAAAKQRAASSRGDGRKDVNPVYTGHGGETETRSAAADQPTDGDVNPVYTDGGRTAPASPADRPAAAGVNPVYTGEQQTVPEPRDETPAMVTLHVDPTDTSAAVRAIREAFGARHSARLAQALQASFMDPAYIDVG